MRARETKQKQIIEDEMKNLSNFFDAAALHKQIIRKNKRIGIATIYRFLRDFVEEGKIHSYTCDRRTIYSLNKKSHCHFICETCGSTSHFAIKNLDFLKKEIKSQVCHFQIDVTGICEKCQKNK